MDIEEVKEFIRNSSETTSIYIGCDSQRNKKKKTASYARVVVVHKDSNKGCKVFGDVQVQPDYGNLRQRLMAEVTYAIHLALELVDDIGERPFEIHIDINPDHKYASSVVVKEATGYVRGTLGFDAKIKPNALASSYAADALVRGLM